MFSTEYRNPLNCHQYRDHLQITNLSVELLIFSEFSINLKFVSLI